MDELWPQPRPRAPDNLDLLTAELERRGWQRFGVGMVSLRSGAASSSGRAVALLRFDGRGGTVYLWDNDLRYGSPRRAVRVGRADAARTLDDIARGVPIIKPAEPLTLPLVTP